MTKDAVFTMKLEPELRDQFMAAAAAARRPASQIMRELMLDFVAQKEEAEAYKEFVRRKVEIGRAQIKAGQTSSHEEVEARFAKLRAELISRL